jgi:hypothetical protein
MSSHYAQVGFPAVSQDDLMSVLDAMVKHGSAVAVRRGVTLRKFRDPSGAGGDVVMVPRKMVDCAKPTFHGEPGATVRIGRVSPDAECEWCSVVWLDVLEDGEDVYPAVVEVAGFAEVLPRLVAGTECRASLALFAHELGPQVAEPAGLADRAAIPTGSFGDTPRAEMLIAGRVLAAERRTNTLTGGTFGWARVESLAATYDVLVPDALPAVGDVVQAIGWLVADLDLPARRRWHR